MLSRRFGFVSLLGAVAIAGLLPEPAPAQGPYQYHAVTPCRAVDTRIPEKNSGPVLNGPPQMTAGVARAFFIQGTCGVPDTAAAVTVNVTVVLPTVQGFVSLWPNPGTFPTVSTLNFRPGEPAIANGAIVPLGNCSAPCADLNTVYGTAGGGTLDLVIDVTGYFE